jgi:gluconate kinase
MPHPIRLDGSAVLPYSRIESEEGDGMPDEMVKTTIRLPKSLLKVAKHIAVDMDCDLQDVVAEAIRQLAAKKAVK